MIRKKIYVFLLSAALVFSINSTYAADDGWILQRDKEGVQVYIRKTEGHLTREYRGVAYVKVPLSHAITLFEETARMPEWLYLCKEFRPLPPRNPGENIFYFRQQLPAPAHERDVVVSLTRTEDPAANAVFYTLLHIPGAYPVQDNVRRMPYFKAVWRFSSAKKDIVKVEYRFQADPGGNISMWLPDNIFYVDLPFYSLRQFQVLAENPR